MWEVYFSYMGACSLVPRHKDEEEKGPGFSHCLNRHGIPWPPHTVDILHPFVTHSFDTKRYTVRRFIMLVYGVQRIYLIMLI